MVDALGLGPSGVIPVEVQVLSRAQCLFLVFYLSDDFVHVLAMSFSDVDCKFNVGDDFELAVVFNVFPHVACVAFEKDERVLFATVRNRCNKNGRFAVVGRDVRFCDRNERITV